MAVETLPLDPQWHDAPRSIDLHLGDRLSCGQASELVHNVLFSWSGFVIVPSDTGYAFVTLPTDRRAIQILVRLLRHQRDPIPLSFDGIRQVADWIDMNVYQRRVFDALWPGAVTVVGHARGLQAKMVARNLLSLDGTLGVRVTSGIERDLIVEAGLPLTTAAVRDDRGVIVRSYEEAVSTIWKRLKGEPDIKVPWAAIRSPKPFAFGQHSTVVAIERGGGMRRLRDGAIPYSQIERYMQRVSSAEYGDAT